MCLVLKKDLVFIWNLICVLGGEHHRVRIALRLRLAKKGQSEGGEKRRRKEKERENGPQEKINCTTEC